MKSTADRNFKAVLASSDAHRKTTDTVEASHGQCKCAAVNVAELLLISGLDEAVLELVINNI